MSVALMILILIHFGFRSVYTEWFWCIVVAGVIVGLIGRAIGVL